MIVCCSRPLRLPFLGNGQRERSRRPATAKRRWAKEANVPVMGCYFMGNPKNNTEVSAWRYNKRRHRASSNKGICDLSEQNLCKQVRNTRKTERLFPVGLENSK